MTPGVIRNTFRERSEGDQHTAENDACTGGRVSELCVCYEFAKEIVKEETPAPGL